MTLLRDNFLPILLCCLFVHVDKVLCGRKNSLNLSKGEPSPLLFWPIQTTKHNRTDTAGKMIATLHGVDLTVGPTTNGGTLDALHFTGTLNTYAKIQNINGILNGNNAMNWMFYLYYPDNTMTATILEYCNIVGTSGFSLGVNSGRLAASFSDQNGVVYNPESSFTLPELSWTFVGINFNRLWDDDQFDLFMIDNSGDLISETFSLGASTLLQIQALGSVVLGSNQYGSANFEGKLACIQFSNKSQIKSPQDEAPSLCDPNVWVDSDYGDFTQDAIITTTAPPTTTTTLGTTTLETAPPTTTPETTTLETAPPTTTPETTTLETAPPTNTPETTTLETAPPMTIPWTTTLEATPQTTTATLETSAAITTTNETTSTSTTTPTTTVETTNTLYMPVSTVNYSNISDIVCKDDFTAICHCVTPFTAEELVRRVEWLRALLTVDKRTTSAAIRLRTSATDDRISVVAIGGFGLGILSALTIGIVLPDILDLGSFFYKSYRKSGTYSIP